jgi:hypothetical protein
MRECRQYGSVRGDTSNGVPYREHLALPPLLLWSCQRQPKRRPVQPWRELWGCRRDICLPPRLGDAFLCYDGSGRRRVMSKIYTWVCKALGLSQLSESQAVEPSVESSRLRAEAALRLSDDLMLADTNLSHASKLANAKLDDIAAALKLSDALKLANAKLVDASKLADATLAEASRLAEAKLAEALELADALRLKS